MKVAINGYGRIGRNIARALCERADISDIQIVAINDTADLDVLAHLTRYDSVHGPLDKPVTVKGNVLSIGKHNITYLQEKNPQKLPWKTLGIDLVMECSGFFCSREKSQAHLDAGAKKVLISAPAKDVDATIVYGVNENTITSAMSVISNASCTTNCLAPVAKKLHEEIGIENGMMTTIHAYTNDQNLTDSYHPDYYRSRAAALNMIPTKTGAAEAVGLVIPELQNRMTGMAVRVPTANVSLIDCCFAVSNTVSADQVNHFMMEAADRNPEIIQCNSLPLVSGDFNHCSASSVVDLTQTKVTGSLVKIMSWYDNEWGFSNRMLDTARYWQRTTQS